MSVKMRQIPTHCPNDGEFLWEVERVVTNITTQTLEVKRLESTCRKCQPQRYIELIRSAEKIIPLTDR